jgi:hypothetical protein
MRNYKRKTVTVDIIRDKVNQMIAAPKSTQEGRVALSVFLSSLLLETGNYRGFQYLDWKATGYQKWCEAVEAKKKATPWSFSVNIQPYLGDESRVEYD